MAWVPVVDVSTCRFQCVESASSWAIQRVWFFCRYSRHKSVASVFRTALVSCTHVWEKLSRRKFWEIEKFTINTHFIPSTSSRKVFHSFLSQTLFLFLSSKTNETVAIFSSSVFQLVPLKLIPTGSINKLFPSKVSKTHLMVLLLRKVCDFKNSFKSFRKSFFLGQPGIDRTYENKSHCGSLSFVLLPGMGFPLSSFAHQQYPVDR